MMGNNYWYKGRLCRIQHRKDYWTHKPTWEIQISHPLDQPCTTLEKVLWSKVSLKDARRQFREYIDLQIKNEQQ